MEALREDLRAGRDRDHHCCLLLWATVRSQQRNGQE
jgi:hypothetical protein